MARPKKIDAYEHTDKRHGKRIIAKHVEGYFRTIREKVGSGGWYLARMIIQAVWEGLEGKENI